MGFSVALCSNSSRRATPRALKVLSELACLILPRGELGPEQPLAPGFGDEVAQQLLSVATDRHTSRAVALRLADLAALCVARSVDVNRGVREVDVLAVQRFEFSGPGGEVRGDGVALPNVDGHSLALDESQKLRRVEERLALASAAVGRGHPQGGVVVARADPKFTGFAPAGACEERGEHPQAFCAVFHPRASSRTCSSIQSTHDATSPRVMSAIAFAPNWGQIQVRRRLSSDDTLFRPRVRRAASHRSDHPSRVSAPDGVRSGIALLFACLGVDGNTGVGGLPFWGGVSFPARAISASIRA